jgi:hypothetical protein
LIITTADESASVKESSKSKRGDIEVDRILGAKFPQAYEGGGLIVVKRNKIK